MTFREVSFTLIVGSGKETAKMIITAYTKPVTPETLMSYQEYPYSELYEREIMLGHLVYIQASPLIRGMGYLPFCFHRREQDQRSLSAR